MKAQQALRLHVAGTPSSSVSVEMKHLLGQEVRRARSRGMACRPAELGKRTYHRLLLRNIENKTDYVLRRVLPKGSLNAFCKLASRQALQKTRVRDAARETRRRMTKTRGRPTRSSAWSMYKKTHFNPTVRPCTPE
eukprot:2953898-Pyramimonas_sp.AAC.1